MIGLTSAGSGTLIAVFLIAYYRLVPRNVVGTDVFHAAILLWAAAIAHIVAGNVDFGLVGAILIGSIPGVWIGSHLSVKLPERRAAHRARGGDDRRGAGAVRQGRRRSCRWPCWSPPRWPSVAALGARALARRTRAGADRVARGKP